MTFAEVVPHLSTLNAFLNGVSTVLLVAALVAIKARRELLHKRLMLLALGVSAVFLTSYLIYHAQVGSVPFEGQGWVRPLYFIILVPHIILAAVQLPLILMAVYYAFRENRAKHRRIVRWAYPLWLYVSITGVVIYWMLYHYNHSPV